MIAIRLSRKEPAQTCGQGMFPYRPRDIGLELLGIGLDWNSHLARRLDQKGIYALEARSVFPSIGTRQSISTNNHSTSHQSLPVKLQALPNANTSQQAPPLPTLPLTTTSYQYACPICSFPSHRRSGHRLQRFRGSRRRLRSISQPGTLASLGRVSFSRFPRLAQVPQLSVVPGWFPST